MPCMFIDVRYHSYTIQTTKAMIVKLNTGHFYFLTSCLIYNLDFLRLINPNLFFFTAFLFLLLLSTYIIPGTMWVTTVIFIFRKKFKN